METDWLREFISLTETSSFQETAVQFYTTQSTISKHLKKLEEEWGVSLLQRSSRHVELSEIGKLLCPSIKKILTAEEELKQLLNEQAEKKQTIFRIGSIPDTASYGITDILFRFHQKNPAIQIQFQEAESRILCDLVLNGTLEMAFVREPIEHPSEINRQLYCQDEMVAMLPANHPLAHFPSLSLKTLSNENFLFVREHSLLYQMAYRACQEAGFIPKVLFSAHHLDNLIDLTAKGMGITLLMKKQAVF